MFCIDFSTIKSLKIIYLGPLLAYYNEYTDDGDKREITPDTQNIRGSSNAKKNENASAKLSTYVPTAIIFNNVKEISTTTDNIVTKSKENHFFCEALFPNEFGSSKLYPWKKTSNDGRFKIPVGNQGFNKFTPLSTTHKWGRYDDLRTFQKDFDLIPIETAIADDVINSYIDCKKTTLNTQTTKIIDDADTSVKAHFYRRPLESNVANMNTISNYYQVQFKT